jgi:hypothetical protein
MLFDNHASPTPPEKSDDFSLTKAKLDALLCLNSKIAVDFKKLHRTAKKARTFKGFKYIGRQTVKFSDIYMQTEGDGNSVRADGVTKSNVEDIKESFSSGVIYDEYLPILKFKNNRVKDANGVETGEAKSFEIVDGNHRVPALQKLNKDEWVFDVYQYDPSNTDGIRGKTLSEAESTKMTQMIANGHPPKHRAAIADVVKTVISILHDKESTSIEMIEDGFSDTSLKEFIDFITPNMLPRLRNDAYITIVNAYNTTAQSSKGKQSSIATEFHPYNADSAALFLNRTPGDWKSGGIEDPIRNKFAYIMHETSVTPTVFNALLSFKKYGKTSYVIIHAKERPTDTKPLDVTIAKVQARNQQLKELILHVAKYYNETGIWPVEIVGRLPQMKKVDSFASLIPVGSKGFKTTK